MSMLTTKSLHKRVAYLTDDLTGKQKAQLAVMVSKSIAAPSDFMAARKAAKEISDHADDLMRLSLLSTGSERFDLPSTPKPTHGRRTERPRAARLRAVWKAVCKAEAAFSESLCGDLLAGVCFVILVIGLVYGAWWLG